MNTKREEARSGTEFGKQWISDVTEVSAPFLTEWKFHQ
jgi:hypothetical protein